MDRFALIGFWRSLTRHRLYAALNIGGLALGIAVFLVLSLYVRFETGYEKWLPHHTEIYQLEAADATDIGSVRNRAFTSMAAMSAIWADHPDTVGTRILTRDAAVIKDGVGVREQVSLVDRSFFHVFDLSPVMGSIPMSFADPTSLVITERTSRKYFGDSSPIGRTLPVTVEGERQNFRIIAVIADLPRNTDLDLDLIAPVVIPQDRSLPENEFFYRWNYGGPKTYVRLPDRSALAPFNAALRDVVRRHARIETPGNPNMQLSMWATPLTDVHFEAPGARLTVVTLGIIGLLTLAIAVVNYVNLATARAGLRAREVAMRKVLGADRGSLMRHYVGEAVATTFIAMVGGLALAELGLPLVNAATGLDLSIAYVGANGVLLPLLGLGLVVGIAAGLYPAVILARIPAASTLAASRTPGGGRTGSRIREALVVFQFAVTIAMIVGTMVLAAQTRHIRNADVGYDRAQLLVIRSLSNPGLDSAQRTMLLHRFESIPGVQGVTGGSTVPGLGLSSMTRGYTTSGYPAAVSVERVLVLSRYFEVMGARLLAGRLFDASRPADFDPTSGHYNDETLKQPANLVINRAAATALHFRSPAAAIGKTLEGGGPRIIVGVIDDMRFGSARTGIVPTVYQLQPKPVFGVGVIIRFAGDPKRMLETVQATWRATAPAAPFQGQTAVMSLDHLQKSDNQMANLFAIGSILAVAIGCVGLWGLASFTTARRVHEIGIRKTLGASSLDVVRLLVLQFLRPVLLANLFAWPLAYVAMRNWLAGFDDRIALSPLFFVGATVLATLIAVATAVGQSIRAARATPAWALRHE